MTRGLLHASDFRAGDVVTIGDASRVVRGTADGLVFEARGASPMTTTIALRPDCPPVVVGARNLMEATVEPWIYGLHSSVDTETTGLGPDARICEIGVVQMRFGLVVDAWSSLVNPGIPIPPEATAVHGITNDMVANAPTISQLRPEIDARLCASVVALGYNIYGYDEPVLLDEGVGFPRPIIDILPAVREHAVSWLTGLPAKRWKSESERRERDEDDTGPVVWNWRKIGRHSLERASRELEQADPEKSVTASLHRAAWDAVLTGRLAWQLRGWLREPALTLEPRLRELLDRQNAATAAFIAQKRAEEALVRKSPETRVREALAELRDVIALLDGYEAWKRGAKTPDEPERAPEVRAPRLGDGTEIPT